MTIKAQSSDSDRVMRELLKEARDAVRRSAAAGGNELELRELRRAVLSLAQAVGTLL